jgi:hypothetical protein
MGGAPGRCAMKLRHTHPKRPRLRPTAPFSRDPRQLPLPGVLPISKRNPQPPAGDANPAPWPEYQTDLEEYLRLLKCPE